MQSALAEVELSATAGTRVFGPEHGRRLAELRRAQIELAQAWARSEGALAGDEESVPGRSEVKGGLRDGAAAGSGAVGGSAAAGPSGTGAGTGQGQGSGSAGGDAAGKTGTADGGGSVTGSAARPGSSSGGPPGQGIPAGGTTGATAGLGTKLEEETEMDILLARKRREANDRYFQRVNEGLLDVVEKLELVAVSMRAVEQESKDMWFEGDSQGEEQDEGAGNGAGDEMSNGSRPSTAEKDIGR